MGFPMTQDSLHDPIEEMLKAVMDRRRRQVLRVLIENDGAVIDVDELVAHLSERTDAETRANSRDAERIGITLHHANLPLLENAGMIDYNERSQSIRYRPDDRLERLLCVIEEVLE